MTGQDCRDQRKKLKLNQKDYWGRVSVTQSGGCRLEKGRDISKPVQALLTLAYGKPAQAEALFRKLRK